MKNSTASWGTPRKGPGTSHWGTPRKDMGPVEVLWNGDGVPHLGVDWQTNWKYNLPSYFVRRRQQVLFVSRI